MAGRSPDIGSGDLLNQAAARRRSAGRGEWAAGMRGRWAEGSRQARLACRAEAWRRLEGLCLNPKTTGKESTHASTLRGGARKNHAPDPESVARFAETLRLRSLAAALPSIRQIVADTGLRRNGIPGGARPNPCVARTSHTAPASLGRGGDTQPATSAPNTKRIGLPPPVRRPALPPSIDGLVQPASRCALRRSRTLRVELQPNDAVDV